MSPSLRAVLTSDLATNSRWEALRPGSAGLSIAVLLAARRGRPGCLRTPRGTARAAPAGAAIGPFFAADAILAARPVRDLLRGGGQPAAVGEEGASWGRACYRAFDALGPSTIHGDKGVPRAQPRTARRPGDALPKLLSAAVRASRGWPVAIDGNPRTHPSRWYPSLIDRSCKSS